MESLNQQITYLGLSLRNLLIQKSRSNLFLQSISIFLKSTMLTNDYGQKWTQRFKQNFFNTQMSLMSNRLQLPLFVHYGVAIIMFWFNISIFFLNNPLTPQIINDIFQLVLTTRFSEKTSIPLEIFRILMIVIQLQLIALYIIHFRSNFMNNSLTKYLNLLIFVYMMAIVPTTYLTIYSLKSINSSSETPTIIISVSLFIVSNICNVIVGAFTYFKVRPFRKKSAFWSLDNSKEFYWYVLNFVRVLVIMLDDRTVSFLIISFVIEIFLRQSVNNYFTKEAKQVHSFLSNLALSGHLALLVKDFTSSPDIATQILCFLLLVTLVSGALSCYSLMHEERYFPLCNSPIWQYYDFYFHFVEKKIKRNNKSKMSMKKDSDSDKILSIHALNCQEKTCKIKNVKFSQDTYCEDLENLSSQTMIAKCNDSELNELINELWKFQTGNKYKFRMQAKKIPLIYEYVIYCVLNLSRLNQKSDSVNQENIKSLKNIFYDKLQNCLECFSLFYEEITKTQPKIDTVLNVGNDIKKRAQDLKTLYSELLKHSVINFKTAEVYVEFENYFLKENNVNEESIDRLRKIQKSREADHIEEIYLPTLTSYAESGLIENMNTECLSFFKLTRFEMKSKSFGSLLFPEVNSIAQIKQRLKSNKNQKMCTFFKRRNEMVYGSICIKEKYIENKKFDVVTIEKNAYSDYKNVLLIKKDTLAIEALEKEQTYIRPKINFSNHLTLRWRQLYENYLQQKIEQLADQKIVKVRIEELENSLFVMNVEESLHEEYYAVNIKVIKDVQKRRKRISSFMINKPQVLVPRAGKFYFFYDIKDSKSEFHLYGVNGNQFTYACSLKKAASLGLFEKDLSNMIVANTLLQQNRYTRGIKTYRLWKKELYNIDLEDKDQYVEQFNDKISNSTDKPMGKVSETDLYIMTGIFSILVILVGLSLGYNSIATSLHDDIVTYYSKGLKIQQLRLHMNRIASITRDIESYRYKKFPTLDWKKDILTSYTNLKQLRYQQLLFENEQIVVRYRNMNYTGTLNEIIDVIISHVYEMTLGTLNLTEINYLHQSYISDVNFRIINEKDKLSAKISNTAKNFKKLKEILLIVGVICIFIFYLLLGLLIVVLNTSAKKKLENLMMMSDNEARMNQTMAEKLKYAVDMIKKKFDFDLKTIIGPPEKHKQRKKPKQIIIGIQKKIIIILSLIVGFVVHFVIYYNFTNEISTVLSTISLYQDQGESLMDVYSGFSELNNKIEHFKQYDMNKLANLRQRLSFLIANRMNFEFDTETNSFIDSIFYENSCKSSFAAQIFSGQSVTCENALPQFLVTNPFQIGLLPYFVKANYNVIDNITQAYGCTGLYSSPFIKVFSLLADKMRNCGLDFIEGSFKQLSLYNLIYSIMSLLYAFITLMVIYVLKGMIKEIDELLKFLNYNEKQSNKKKKKEDKQKKESNKDMSSNGPNSEKNDDSENDLSTEKDKKR